MWLSINNLNTYDAQVQQTVELRCSGELCFNFGLDQSNLASNTTVEPVDGTLVSKNGCG